MPKVVQTARAVSFEESLMEPRQSPHQPRKAGVSQTDLGSGGASYTVCRAQCRRCGRRKQGTRFRNYEEFQDDGCGV